MGKALERDVGKALEAEIRRRDGRGLEDLARLAAANWAEYKRDVSGGLMRFQWGASKFYREAHWLGSGTWPYDQAKLAARRSASVGFYRQAAVVERVDEAADAKLQEELAEYEERRKKRIAVKASLLA